MAVTLTAGTASVYEGYTRSGGYLAGLLGTFGTLSAEPIAGKIVDAFAGGSGSVELYLQGDTTSLDPITINVDGSPWLDAASGTYDGLSNTTSYIGTGTFVDTVAYSVAQVVGSDTTAPTITSASTASVLEGARLAHSLTADEAVTWSIVSGADQADFELSGATMRWVGNGTQDYEAPADADTNNAYVVTVRATDGASNTTDQTITVTVTDLTEWVISGPDTFGNGDMFGDGAAGSFFDDGLVAELGWSNFVEPVAAGNNITGSASLTFTPTASIIGRGQVTASSTLTFAPTGTVTGKGAVTGSTSLTFAPTGSLTGKGILTGSASLAFTPAGTVTGTGDVSGSSTLTFTPTASVSGVGQITATSSVTFTPSGAVTGQGAISGASSLTFSLTGSVSSASVGLTGSSSITFTPSATITGKGAVTGTSSIAFAPTGTIAGIGAISGSSSITFVSTALIVDPPVPIVGSSSITFTVAGSLVLPPSTPPTFSRFIRPFLYDLAA